MDPKLQLSDEFTSNIVLLEYQKVKKLCLDVSQKVLDYTSFD